MLKLNIFIETKYYTIFHILIYFIFSIIKIVNFEQTVCVKAVFKKIIH